MEKWERNIIRELANEKLEISNLPIMEKHKELWTKHNNLMGKVPMIHFEVETIRDKGFNYECKCTSHEAVLIERQLGNSLTNYKMVSDDRVVTNDFICLFKSSFIPFNIPVKRIQTEDIGFHIESQVNDLSNTEFIKPSDMSLDYEGSIKWKEFVEEIIGDILNVRMGINSLDVYLSYNIIQLMGMENMFMAMYDNPDEFHFMMDSLSNDYIKYFKELEKHKRFVIIIRIIWFLWGVLDLQMNCRI